MFDLPVLIDANPQQELVLNQCIFEAAKSFDLDPLLLRAIREHERGTIGKFSVNSDGSHDLGPFQINDLHLPRLAKDFGFTRDQVMSDPCVNAFVAGWHLRNKLDETGNDIWRAVGRYHDKRERYARVYRPKVKVRYAKLLASISRSLARIETELAALRHDEKPPTDAPAPRVVVR